MDARLASILNDLGRGDMAAVAAGALGVASVVDPGTVVFDEIAKPHADARTIGVIRASGLAVIAPGQPARAWSSVAKLIDLSVESLFLSATSPANEVLIYEQQLFTGDGLRFRPARCHHIARLRETLTILWLEDLTQAGQPPFELDALSQMARHLGEWNAAVAANPPALGFAIGGDFQARRWRQWDFPARLNDLAGMHADPLVHEMYAGQPLAILSEYVSVFGRLVEQSTAMPHALGLGDCPVGNMFHLPGETVAIDWAGLGSEPFGADGGCFIGSALTWGRRFADTARSERELFESYATGLRDAGSTLDRDSVRGAYLSELGFYVGTIAVLPTMLNGPRPILTHEFWEKRFDRPVAEFGSEASKIVALLPAYIAECTALLA